MGWLKSATLRLNLGRNRSVLMAMPARNPVKNARIPDKIKLSGLPSRLRIQFQKAPAVPQEPKSKPVTYADAGVDISQGDRAKDKIKFLAQKTFNRNVLGGIGGFGALFRLDLQRWKTPILVRSMR